MNKNQFDNEYYVMNVDGANNHPLLAWGKTDYSAFMEAEPIDEKTLELPLKIIFGQPYPKQYEMADFLMLDADFSGSEKLKTLFETLNIYGVQFVPVEITTNKKEVITGHYAIHFHNRLRAIDENNYEGGKPDRFGTIMDLKRFSLNADLFNNIPAEKRKVFLLEENTGIVIVHQSIYEAIQAENLTGMRFWKVSDWDDNAMFRQSV
ncbi:imm11 family protein [Dysgonomonas reticulitermitis]